MNRYVKGLVRWSALGVELFFLFLLAWCIGVCSCPLNPDNLRQVSFFAMGAVVCAFVSCAQSERPKITGTRKVIQIAFEPPIAVLIITFLLLIERVTSVSQSNHAYSVYRIK